MTWPIPESRAEREKSLAGALFRGSEHIVEALLVNEPDLADGTFALQVALGDVESVHRALAGKPELATTETGGRRAILHLCFSHFHRMKNGVAADTVEIARALVRCGADANDSFAQAPFEDHPLSALYGALGHARNLPLAEFLLENGADPNDGECLYHATELDTLDGLKLLMRHRVETRNTNALLRMLDFDNLEGVRLMLEYGADPNEVMDGATDPMTCIHHAILRERDGRFAELLVSHGADTAALRNGHSAYAFAKILANRSVAETLEELGLATALREDEVFLAPALEGDAGAARAIQARNPDIMSDLHPADRMIHLEMTGRTGQLAALELMTEVGFDPNAVGGTGMTALHHAAWAGFAEYVAHYIAAGADLSHINGYGGTAIGAATNGSANAQRHAARDHIACVRLLHDACGRPEITRAMLDTGSPEMTAFLAGLRD